MGVRMVVRTGVGAGVRAGATTPAFAAPAFAAGAAPAPAFAAGAAPAFAAGASPAPAFAAGAAAAPAFAAGAAAASAPAFAAGASPAPSLPSSLPLVTSKGRRRAPLLRLDDVDDQDEDGDNCRD